MSLEITIQNPSPADSPISTTFFGIPDFQLVEGARSYSNGRGAHLEVLAPWGRDWSLCAMHFGALGPFETEVVWLEADGDDVFEECIPWTAPLLGVQAVIEGQTHRVTHWAQFPPHGTSTQSARLKTWFSRIGNTQHVAYLHFYETNRAAIRFEGYIGTSDFRVPDTVSFVDSLELTFGAGIHPVLDFAEQRDIRLQNGKVQLTRDDRFMFGQGFAFSGRLLLLDRMRDGREARAAHATTFAPVVAQVSSQSLEGKWGPFGTLPELHPAHIGREHELASEEYRATLDRFYRYRGDHWNFDGPYTGVLDPRQTGSTETFGMTKLCPTLAVPFGFPAHLHLLMPDIYTEGKRPSHYFENSGLPFLASQHPDFEPYGQEPHFDRNVNPDLLGKPERFTWWTKPTGGWRSEDWAHSGSSIALGAHALLAGSAISRMLCLSDTEMFKTINPDRNAFGQARGMGRALLDVVWANMAVGDAALDAHLVEMLKRNPQLAKVRQQHADGREIVVYEWDEDGDRRKFDGKTPFWMPWSAPGLLLPGMKAAQWLTGTTVAEDEIRMLAATLARFGIWKDPRGRWTVADAIKWNADGSAIDPSAYGDASQVAPGDTFRDWVYPALALTHDGLSGVAQANARAYCDDVRREFEIGPAPRHPFVRPVPFLAVPHPIATESPAE